jgi:hypothetical protein
MARDSNILNASHFLIIGKRNIKKKVADNATLQIA